MSVTSISAYGGFTRQRTAADTRHVVNCIEKVKPPKKASRPVLVELNPNFEFLAQMRNLQITFLDEEGQCGFSS